LQPALEFLAGQGFGWFEILAGNRLSDQFARKYMQLGNQALLATDFYQPLDISQRFFARPSLTLRRDLEDGIRVVEQAHVQG